MPNATDLWNAIREQNTNRIAAEESFGRFLLVFVGSVRQYITALGIDIPEDFQTTRKFKFLGATFEFIQTTDYREKQIPIVLMLHTIRLDGISERVPVERFEVGSGAIFSGGERVGIINGPNIDINHFTLSLLSRATDVLPSYFKL